MARIPDQEIAVTGPKGQRATVIGVQNPSHSHMDDSEPDLIYGIDGLTVERISDSEFRDFHGTIWTIEAGA